LWVCIWHALLQTKFFPKTTDPLFETNSFSKQRTSPPTSKNLLYVVDYDSSEHLFSDRIYTCTLGNDHFKQTKLIKVPEHAFGKIRINILEPLRIFRPITLVNDNSYYAQWEKAYFPIKIISNTCTYEHVVYKDFEPGITTLPYGGPISADPIFIKNLNDIPLGVKSFEILEPEQ
jgi:hypothetical protein